jgi:hypothetical protein
MSADPLKFPAPYFGGKSAIADVVWAALGDCDNFCEPMCGSGAVLLARPHVRGVETVNDVTGDLQNAWRATHTPERLDETASEVINDADPHIANVWRALQADPEGVAEWADHPVHEAYLHAVHRWLVLGDEAAAFRDRMRLDPDYYDAKRAGRWLFGACCWIGGGWCSGPDGRTHGERPRPDINRAHGRGINAAADSEGLKRVKIPDGGTGTGVHGEADIADGRRPAIGQDGHGVTAGPKHDRLPQGRPQLADAHDVGRGVHASPPAGPVGWQERPNLAGPHGYAGKGIHQTDKDGQTPGADGALGTCDARRAWLVSWFKRLRDRLRLVRVCCGDWSRVCSSDSTTVRLGVTGVFLDPPYPRHQKGRKNSRSGGLYATDAAGHKTPEAVRDEVLAWCRERGGHPLMRVVVAGYCGDGYETLVAEHGWTETAWEASGGYGNRTATGKANAKRERLFCSPNCNRDKSLFEWSQDAHPVE